MGCASSKPATPKQKLGDDAKGGTNEHVRSKVNARPHSRQCPLTVQEMCISDCLAAFPDSNLGAMAMSMVISLVFSTTLDPSLKSSRPDGLFLHRTPSEADILQDPTSKTLIHNYSLERSVRYDTPHLRSQSPTSAPEQCKQNVPRA